MRAHVRVLRHVTSGAVIDKETLDAVQASGGAAITPPSCQTRPWRELVKNDANHDGSISPEKFLRAVLRMVPQPRALPQATATLPPHRPPQPPAATQEAVTSASAAAHQSAPGGADEMLVAPPELQFPSAAAQRLLAQRQRSILATNPTCLPPQPTEPTETPGAQGERMASSGGRALEGHVPRGWGGCDNAIGVVVWDTDSIVHRHVARAHIITLLTLAPSVSPCEVHVDPDEFERLIRSGEVDFARDFARRAVVTMVTGPDATVRGVALARAAGAAQVGLVHIGDGLGSRSAEERATDLAELYAAFDFVFRQHYAPAVWERAQAVTELHYLPLGPRFATPASQAGGLVLYAHSMRAGSGPQIACVGGAGRERGRGGSLLTKHRHGHRCMCRCPLASDSWVHFGGFELGRSVQRSLDGHAFFGGLTWGKMLGQKCAS